MSEKIDALLSAAIRLRDRGACVYCGRTIEGTDTVLTVDHLLARVWWTEEQEDEMNDPANLAAACEPCNSLKGAMDVVCFASMLDEHAPRLPERYAHLRTTTGADVIERVSAALARPVDMPAARVALAALRSMRGR